MIKVLVRPTNNAKQFCGQTQGGEFMCEHVTKLCPGLHENFSLHRINVSSFVVCFNVVQLISFWQNNKICSLCQNRQWSKTASLCYNADDPQPHKNFPKQKNLSRTEQNYVSRTAIKVNTTDTRLDLFIAR